MKLYTSYFAQVKKLKEAGVVPVSISLKPPFWYDGEQMKELAPTPKILKAIRETDDSVQYTKDFNEMLSKLDKKEVIAKLEEISDRNGGMPVAILCYEKVTDFCHRHIVAEWLRSEIDITEFGHSSKYDGIMMVQKSYWVE